MGNIIEQKSTLLQDIGLEKMTGEIIASNDNFSKKKKTSSMDSAKEKTKNLLSFMLDLMEAVQGKVTKVKKKISEGKKKRKKKIDAIKDSMPPVVQTLLISVLARLLPTMQQKVLDLLMKYLSDNCALDTPNLSLPIALTNGMKISSTNLDIFRILKEDYNSRAGKIYLQNPNSFAAVLRNAALNPPTIFPYNVITGSPAGLDISYDDVNDEFNIQANQQLQDLSLKDFFNGMLKKVIPFTATVYIGLACDKIYGILSKKIDTTVNTLGQVRTRDDIINEEYIDHAIENYLEYNLDDIVETDTFYTFTDEQKGLIEQKVNSRYNGEGGFHSACGEVEASIPFETFDDVMGLLTGATKSSETKVVGQSLNILGNAATTNLSTEDKETGKKAFFSQLIKLFPVLLTRMFLSPDAVLLIEVSKTIKQQTTGGVGAVNVQKAKSGLMFLQQNTQLLREISKEFYGEIMKELYIIIKEEIMKLVLVKVKAIVAEKAKNYLRILVSGVEARANQAVKKG
tara:strand:+ start:12975 stop:14513 length:1539 start_codon:yes stop_codon:yes gene_type:complete